MWLKKENPNSGIKKGKFIGLVGFLVGKRIFSLGLLALLLLVLAAPVYAAKTAVSDVVWKGNSDKAVAVNITAVQNMTLQNASGAKITSNAHSADFPGLYFIWDSKQTDNGYLKVDARVFDKYDSFILTSKESNTYWDFKIAVQKGQVKTGDGCYVFFIPKVYNNKNINMVFVSQWVEKNTAEKPPVVKYTVNFYDGKTLLKSEQVESGASATAPAVPAQPGTTFTGWDKAFNKVTSNLDVYTVRKAIIYTVNFYDGKNLLKSEQVAYGQGATAPPVPAQPGSTFKGWDKAFDHVTSNLDVNTVREAIIYTVNFYDGKDLLNTQQVAYGQGATAPNVPEQEGYTYAWDTDFTNVTGDLDVHTVWTINEYTVNFYDGKNLLDTQQVAYGQDATAPDVPVQKGYTMTWDKDFTNVTGDLDVHTVWTINEYTVKFYDGNILLDTQQVPYDGSATAPDVPKQEGSTFTGWDKAFDHVTSDLNVNTVREVNEYTVNFYDGKNLLSTQQVEYGHDATAPNVPAQKGYTMTWDKDYTNVTGDLDVYTVWTVNEPENVNMRDFFVNLSLTTNYFKQGAEYCRLEGAIMNYDAATQYHIYFNGVELSSGQVYDGWSCSPVAGSGIFTAQYTYYTSDVSAAAGTFRIEAVEDGILKQICEFPVNPPVSTPETVIPETINLL